MHPRTLKLRDVRQAPKDRLPLEGETLGHLTQHGPDYKIDPETGCWLWQKNLTKAGYPNGFPKPHHRYYVRATGREIPKGWHVHHKCKTKACVNPAHLEAIEHSSHLTQHKRAVSKFSEADIIAIRESRLTARELAERYDTNESTICNLWWGCEWHHVGTLAKPIRYCLWCNEEVPQHRKRHAKYCCPEHARKMNSRRQYEKSKAA